MLRLTRPFNGMQRIHDRQKGEDGEYTERTHVLLSKDGYSPKELVKYKKEKDEEGNEKKIRFTEMQYGKSFEVMDEEYVLDRHSAILEKA